MRLVLGPLTLVLIAFATGFSQQTARPEAKAEPLRPDWCRALPRPGYKRLERVAVSGDWFEVYKIRPDVYAIYEPHQYEEVISYLILGSDRALLFDTGLGIGDIRSVVLQLTKESITVLNSHTHFDHIGDNWQFTDILGLDSPYSQRNAAGASHEDLRDAVISERFCGKLPAGFRPESYAIPAFKIARHVKDGDVIDLGNRQLQVVTSPGHTPDSICLFDKKNKLLFTGDTFYAGPIFLYVPETNLSDYVKSVARLAAMAPQVDLLLPSHNFPAEPPSEMNKLATALHDVQAGTEKYTRKDGRRDYDFGTFSLITAD